MDKLTSLMEFQAHTRFYFAITSVILTSAILMWGDLSDGGEVAAFGFLGTVALGLGVSKAAEHWKKYNA